ncbi:AMSH-like ubiquitin thioesterase 2 isoform X2 [Humulus lupulus]|nr:AMSH-like ubiquitin thioesterase 2 isoform X2 [Humulus lupulus]
MIVNKEKVGLESSSISCCKIEICCPNSIRTVNESHHIKVHAVTHSFPSTIISCIESVPQDDHISRIEIANPEDGKSNSCTDASSSVVLRDVHISAQLMEDFLELAKGNTEKDLETCGILGASLKKNRFYVTTLIIPKQECTSSSCQASNEEEVFTIQNEYSLFPVGWIHTHPTQSCFMSSVDLHTHYSYQVMVPEAFAVVMAPTDTERSYGIFRLTEPGGMTVLKECQEEGFHPHKETSDGSSIYEHCTNVYKNSNLRFEIFDLR